MWYKNVGIHFFRFIIIHAFDADRRIDRRTDALEIPCVAR